MRYILPTDAIEKLSTLRKQYQEEKKINLDEKPSIIGMPMLFGGVDVESRNKQTVFIQKILTVLHSNLKKIEEIKSPEELLANSAAARLCLVACWYVQSQTLGNSVLSRVINNDLGINAQNYPDQEDKDECYATAKRMVNAKNALEDANTELIKADLKPFSEKEWADFTAYVKEANIKKVSTNSYSNYPITSLTKPLFGAALSYTGATLGLLSGDMISQSTKGMAAQYQLTALVGGSLIMFGPAGPTGVALFAPIIASKLINAFCSITLAHVLGVTMGLLGQGLGTAIGLPLDLAYQLLWKVCAMIGEYCKSTPSNPIISGMRISDGKMIISGIAIEVTPLDKLPEDAIKQKIEIKEDGSMLVDGKAIVIPKEGVHLPPHVIQELKNHIKKCTEEPEKDVAPESTTQIIEEESTFSMTSF